MQSGNNDNYEGELDDSRMSS